MDMNFLLVFLTSINNSEEPNSSASNSSAERITNALKDILKNPIFYIVIGVLFFLVIVFYFAKRIIKSKPNIAYLIIRKKEIHRVICDGDSTYFLMPFFDKIGAVISLSEEELNSDKLFINNGPDALYQINYTLKYRVLNPREFYKFYETIQELIVTSLNDGLRRFADEGNALMIVKDYRDNSSEILKVVNGELEKFSIEATSFKINLIKPLGK